jgi:flagellar export protein FliJ
MARAALAEVLAELATLDARRVAVEQEMTAERAAVRSRAAAGPIDVERLALASRYQAVLQLQIQSLAEQAQTLTLVIDRRREALAEADREVRALEKLRDRQHDEFRQRASRAETKHLDEVAARARVGDAS